MWFICLPCLYFLWPGYHTALVDTLETAEGSIDRKPFDKGLEPFSGRTLEECRLHKNRDIWSFSVRIFYVQGAGW